MKLNIQIDLDWMDEDGNIDDEIKASIENGIIDRISSKCISQIEEKAQNQIEVSMSSAQKIIENEATRFVSDWLDKEVSVTDKWGDIVETCSIEELIKKSFDDLLNKKVDNNGQFTTSSYSGVTLIDWLTNKKAEKIVESKLKDLSKNIDASIKRLVNEEIKKNVSNKFAEMVVRTAQEQNKLEKLS